MLISRLKWVIYSKIKKSFFEENARKLKSVTFNKFTSHWKSLICGFIPLLCCVISKCDIYQIHWKMRKNIPNIPSIRRNFCDATHSSAATCLVYRTEQYFVKLVHHAARAD